MIVVGIIACTIIIAIFAAGPLVFDLIQDIREKKAGR